MRGKPSESAVDPFGRRSATQRRTGPRVGLVLGGGGILGGAWLVGALHSLVEATGWDPTGSTHGRAAVALPTHDRAHRLGRTRVPLDRRGRTHGPVGRARGVVEPHEPLDRDARLRVRTTS